MHAETATPPGRPGPKPGRTRAGRRWVACRAAGSPPGPRRPRPTTGRRWNARLAAGDGQPSRLQSMSSRVRAVTSRARTRRYQQQQDRVSRCRTGCGGPRTEHQPHLRLGDRPGMPAAAGCRRTPPPGRVSGQQALAARAQEHAQRPAAAPHRRLARPAPARSAVNALRIAVTAPPGQRRRSGPGRPRSRPGGAGSPRSIPARPCSSARYSKNPGTARLKGSSRCRPCAEAGQDHRQHLLDRPVDLERHPGRGGRGHPHGDEIIDMSRQVRQSRALHRRAQRSDATSAGHGADRPCV